GGRGPAGPPPGGAARPAQLEALAAAVTTGASDPRLGTAADGLAVMNALDAVRACAAGGRPVPVGR
ncbi:MAG: hypothetical protein L0I24_11330, partial [Pseudonocardia sp.]|nr:hypothetical protein [Pseudonocardia sp.]